MIRTKRAEEYLSSIIATMKHNDDWKDKAIAAGLTLAMAVRDYHHCRRSWTSVIRALRAWQRAVGVTQTPLPKD